MGDITPVSMLFLLAAAGGIKPSHPGGIVGGGSVLGCHCSVEPISCYFVLVNQLNRVARQ